MGFITDFLLSIWMIHQGHFAILLLDSIEAVVFVLIHSKQFVVVWNIIALLLAHVAVIFGGECRE
jgi:hypothetical protein